MRNDLGLIHIYCGEGKGKTTCAVGLTVRASGYGLKVLFMQFLKTGKSSELKVLSGLEGVDILETTPVTKFSFQMTDEEKEETRRISAKEIAVIDFLKNKPEHLEVVLTGRYPSDELVELADYVSRIDKVKHPYDRGIKARKGIEA